MHAGCLGTSLQEALAQSIRPGVEMVDEGTPLSPAPETGRALAKKIERFFLALRRYPAAPEQAIRQLQALLGVIPEPLGATARATLILTGLNHAYHNRHHVTETIFAMGWLCWIAHLTGHLCREDAWLGVLAMAAHDVGHDGSCNRDGRLEREAAETLIKVGSAAGLSDSALHTLRVVIHATGPEPLHPRPLLIPATHPSKLTLLSILAREADIAASVTPHLGWRLSAALQHEWRAALGEQAERPATFVGRLTLLRRHKQLSEFARLLGLQAVVKSQYESFELVGNALGIKQDPLKVAIILDSMPWRKAGRMYRAAHQKIIKSHAV